VDAETAAALDANTPSLEDSNAIVPVFEAYQKVTRDCLQRTFAAIAALDPNEHPRGRAFQELRGVKSEYRTGANKDCAAWSARMRHGLENDAVEALDLTAMVPRFARQRKQPFCGPPDPAAYEAAAQRMVRAKMDLASTHLVLFSTFGVTDGRRPAKLSQTQHWRFAETPEGNFLAPTMELTATELRYMEEARREMGAALGVACGCPALYAQAPSGNSVLVENHNLWMDMCRSWLFRTGGERAA
jgi:hypothetical protein